MEISLNILNEVWYLTMEMSPYLILGFLIAGILKLFIPTSFLVNNLSKPNLSSVFKAALLGIPLPLCSCGVIPVASHIKKEGASNGAVLSFLVSTPTSGVDSILATYALISLPFAIIRVLASFIGGFITGLFANISKTQNKPKAINSIPKCAVCNTEGKHKHNIYEKIKAILDYGFVELFNDISKWLIIGIVVGALITFLIPETFVSSYFSNPVLTYGLMLIIGIPMYVCSTGSIPIAASLILKGFSPGSALIFLIVGPATNTATLSFVGGKFGYKNLFYYILSLIIVSVGFAALIDSFPNTFTLPVSFGKNHEHSFLHLIKHSSSYILIAILTFNIIKKMKRGRHSHDHH
jgi:uncharacterized membrane protein YraQ (UPF0718 family)